MPCLRRNRNLEIIMTKLTVTMDFCMLQGQCLPPSINSPHLATQNILNAIAKHRDTIVIT
jgi:hypothetical protein